MGGWLRACLGAARTASFSFLGFRVPGVSALRPLHGSLPASFLRLSPPPLFVLFFLLGDCGCLSAVVGWFSRGGVCGLGWLSVFAPLGVVAGVCRCRCWRDPTGAVGRLWRLWGLGLWVFSGMVVWRPLCFRFPVCVPACEHLVAFGYRGTG